MDDIPDNSQPPADVHHKIGLLTRQLHDSLNELGYADKLRGSMGELPDAQSRLSYIARLTGEAAEKVLNRVEQAKAQHDYIAAETRRVVTSLVKDPVAARLTTRAITCPVRSWKSCAIMISVRCVSASFVTRSTSVRKFMISPLATAATGSLTRDVTTRRVSAAM